MRTRLMLGAAAVAALALLGSACSSDDKADSGDKTTTTAAGEPDPTAPSTTLSDEEFTASIDKVNESVVAAGDDLCKVLATQSQGTPMPANASQMEQIVRSYAATFEAIGRSIEAENAEAAAGYVNAGKGLLEEGEAAGFAPEFGSETTPAALTTPEFTAAQQVVGELAGACTPAAAGSGDAPTETTPEG